MNRNFRIEIGTLGTVVFILPFWVIGVLTTLFWIFG